MKIAVYCGSDFGNNEEYAKAARELGQWIGKSKHTLVYGGGESGLMGAVAKEVHAEGSEVIGVIPGNVEFIKSRPQPYVTKLITTTNMSERKQKCWISQMCLSLCREVSERLMRFQRQ